MLEPESFEEYLRWTESNPIKASSLDWWPSNSYGSDVQGVHIEILGYLRWCKMMRLESTEKGDE